MRAPYASRRSLGKAISRARKNLPASPRKASIVVTELAASYGIVPTRPRSTAACIPQATVEAVSAFYCRDDISRQSPGRRDYVTVQRDGQKEQLQKHHLVMSVREAYSIFKSEMGDQHKIGKSKFAELRPKNVLPMSFMPVNVCVCQHHENPNFLLAALKSEIPDFPCDHRSLMEVLGCNQDDIACMSPGCKRCQDALQGLRATVAEETLGHNLVYKQWVRDDDGQTKRLSTEVTVEDGLDELVRIVPDLLFHCCIKPEQARFCQHLLASPDHYLL